MGHLKSLRGSVGHRFAIIGLVRVNLLPSNYYVLLRDLRVRYILFVETIVVEVS